MSKQIIELPYDKECWVDADQKMFDACFLILVDFVENELGKITWNKGKDIYRDFRLHSTEEKEKTAIDLYYWYVEELPKLKKDVAEDLHSCYIEDENSLLGIKRVKKPKYSSDYVDEICDKKLKELIEIRRALWT